jgi:hypothetical protein
MVVTLLVNGDIGGGPEKKTLTMGSVKTSQMSTYFCYPSVWVKATLAPVRAERSTKISKKPPYCLKKVASCSCRHLCKYHLIAFPSSAYKENQLESN